MRVRAPTRVLHFLLSQVSHFIRKLLKNRWLSILCTSIKKKARFSFQQSREKWKKSVDRNRKWWWCSANCVIIWESISLVWIFRKYVHLFSWTCAYFLLFSVYSSVKCSLFPLQTTWCFTTNDVSFYRKRRVVLPKTTCCFSENEYAFVWLLWHLWQQKNRNPVGCACVMRACTCVLREERTDWG